MKIVNVIGGLGNQMFQCAFAIALQKAYKDETIKLDISHFNGYGLHNGFEVKVIFQSYPISIAGKEELKKVSRYIPNYKWSRIVRRLLPHKNTEYIQLYPQSYVFDQNAVQQASKYQYYEGYWMCPAYFEPCKDAVVKAFSFPPFNTEENKMYEKLLRGENSVTMHVRRGDYVGAKSFKDICTLTYYRNAIKEARKYINNPVFFVFSNDPEWCVSNLKEEFASSTVHFITNNKGKESFRDMQLMSLSRCNILANSSFSWWGAYLNQRKDHLVFCPNKWVNGLEYKDHYVNGWIKIEIQ